MRLPLIAPRVLRVLLAPTKVHAGERTARHHLRVRVWGREAEETAEEPAAAAAAARCGARDGAGLRREKRRADLRGEALPLVALSHSIVDLTALSFSSREKLLARRAQPPVQQAGRGGFGRGVSRDAGGRSRSFRGARRLETSLFAARKCDGGPFVCENIVLSQPARAEKTPRSAAQSFPAPHHPRANFPRSLSASHRHGRRGDMIGDNSPFNLDGKCAVVTGGTKGLGCVARAPRKPPARRYRHLSSSALSEKDDDRRPIVADPFPPPAR